jgi:hypothetical protein
VSVCIGLLTCGRDELTRRTVDSFLRHNDPDDFVPLHVDDSTPSFEWSDSFPFVTIEAFPERRGQMAGVRALVEEAARRGCEWFVLQENDWPWLEPFPWAELHLMHGFDTLRLYGAHKMLHDGPRSRAGLNCLASGRPIVWEPVEGNDGLEWAYAHWVPLSVTRVDVLLPMVRGCASVKDMCRSQALATLRVKRNIVHHASEETTPGFLP